MSSPSCLLHWHLFLAQEPPRPEPATAPPAMATRAAATGAEAPTKATGRGRATKSRRSAIKPGQVKLSLTSRVPLQTFSADLVSGQGCGIKGFIPTAVILLGESPSL